MLRVCLLFIFFLTSCSHNYFVQDRSNPHYYTGGSRFFPINFLGMAKQVSEKPGSIDSVNESASSSNRVQAEQAAASVLASGISLLVNKDYYESPYISGTCLCSSVKDSVIELPCSDLTLKLLDSAGREIQKVHTHDGDFMFAVEANKEYAVTVESVSYQVLGDVKKPLFLGDKVLIHLIPVPQEKLMLAQ